MPNCRLLILTPQLPFPPDQGAPIRNWNFLRYLGSSEQYDVTLLSFSRTGETGSPAEDAARLELSGLCHKLEIVPAPSSRSKVSRIMALFTNSQPDLASRLASAAFQAKLDHLLQNENYDALLCEGLELVSFVMQAVQALPKTVRAPRLILDEHNAEWLLQHRAYLNDREAGVRRYPAAGYSFVQARRLRQYEANALQFFDAAIAVSPDDKAALVKIGGLPEKITVIPNGIDINEFSPRKDVKEESSSLVFTGTMDFRPNVDAVCWFAQEIWPLILRQNPSARFTIVGRRPTPVVKALAEKAGITVTGSVPDARPYVWSSSLYVVPMRIGGGVRFKVLEALAMGRAVVTTSMGADGIPLVPDRDAVIATEPQAFANAVLDLLDNLEFRNQLGTQGRNFVATHFDWRKITPLLDNVLLNN